jgi:outer membrane cobalamin receptor
MVFRIIHGAVGFCLVVGGLCLPWGVRAQDPTDQQLPEDETPMFFETATVRARPLTQATASVTVLDRDAIESLNVLTTAELMRFVPGVNLSTAGGRAGLAEAQVRGGESNFTVVLVDGVPVNDATDPIRGGAVNLNSLPVNQVERVEVVRGPLSSFFGSQALGGVINIITKRGGDREPAWSAEAQVGNDSTYQVAATVARGTEKKNWFVGFSWQQEEEKTGDDSFEQLALQGNTRLDLGRRGSLGITGRITAWEGDDYSELSGGPELGTGETRHSENEQLSLGADWRFGAEGREQKLWFTGLHHNLDRQTPEVPLPDPQDDIPAITEETEYTDLRAGWLYPVLRPGRSQLNVGVEARWEKAVNDSTLCCPFGLMIPGSYDESRTTPAAFLDFVSERGVLVYELGARVDVPEGHSAELSPRLGVTYRFPGHATRIRASVARGFKLPGFFVLSSPPALGGNPDLDPESSVGGDVGVEHDFDSASVSTSLTVFASRYKDLIDYIFEGPAPQAINRDNVDSRGVEVALGWQATQHVSLKLNVTGQDVEDSDTGERIRARPEWVGATRFDWRIREDFRWTADLQVVSGATHLLGTTDGYQLWGTALFYDGFPKWRLQLRADNLADEEYETFVGIPGAGRSIRFGFVRSSR